MLDVVPLQLQWLLQSRSHLLGGADQWEKAGVDLEGVEDGEDEGEDGAREHVDLEPEEDAAQPVLPLARCTPFSLSSLGRGGGRGLGIPRRTSWKTVRMWQGLRR